MTSNTKLSAWELINGLTVDESEKKSTSSGNRKTDEILDNAGFYIMLNYIKAHKEDAPEPMRNSHMRDEYGLTLAMYWIYIMADKIRQMIKEEKLNETVPAWMRHDPNVRDSHGWTIAMHWATIYGTEPPLWMHCDPNIQTDTGKTLLMIYLTFYAKARPFKFDHEVWMRPRLDIFDKDGNSIIDYWLACTRAELPDWMLAGERDDVNGNGETRAMSWVIRRGTVPPINLTNTPTLKTKYGLTMEDLCYKFNLTPPEWAVLDVERYKKLKEPPKNNNPFKLYNATPKPKSSKVEYKPFDEDEDLSAYVLE